MTRLLIAFDHRESIKRPKNKVLGSLFGRINFLLSLGDMEADLMPATSEPEKCDMRARSLFPNRRSSKTRDHGELLSFNLVLQHQTQPQSPHALKYGPNNNFRLVEVSGNKIICEVTIEII